MLKEHEEAPTAMTSTKRDKKNKPCQSKNLFKNESPMHFQKWNSRSWKIITLQIVNNYE